MSDKKIGVLGPKGCGKSFACVLLYLLLNVTNKLYLMYRTFSKPTITMMYLQHCIEQNGIQLDLPCEDIEGCAHQLISHYDRNSRELFVFIDFCQFTEADMPTPEALIGIALLPCITVMAILSDLGHSGNPQFRLVSM